MVIDFAIEGDPNEPVFIAHRLGRRLREVDDREPPMGQADSPVRAHPYTVTIGPPMPHGFAHRNKIALFRTIVPRKAHQSRYSAHDKFNPRPLIRQEKDGPVSLDEAIDWVYNHTERGARSLLSAANRLVLSKKAVLLSL